MLLLALLFSYQRFRIKGLLAVSLLSTGLFTLFVIYSGKAQRVLAGFAQLQSFMQTHAADLNTSAGQRLTFWKHSLTLFMEKPWFGHGTGSFAGEYQRVASLDSMINSSFLDHTEGHWFACLLALCFAPPWKAPNKTSRITIENCPMPLRRKPEGPCPHHKY